MRFLEVSSRSGATMLIRDLPAHNAIKIGRLFHKPRDIEEILTMSCRMVLFEAPDRSVPLGRGGSSTLLRHRGTDYIVATRHQLGIKPGVPLPISILDTLRISTGEGVLSNIPVKRVVYETGNPDEEFHDVLIFKVADEWEHRHRDRPYFFQLAPFSRQQRTKSFLVGYPSIDVVMEEYLADFQPGQPGTVHIKRAIVDCEIDTSFRTNVQHFRRYQFSRSRDVVDGYSGGAVFSLVGDLGNHEIVLDGIVVRAGADCLHIVDADYLVEVFSTI